MASITIETGDKVMEKQEAPDGGANRSIRFDDPGVYHHYQMQYPKNLEFDTAPR